MGAYYKPVNTDTQEGILSHDFDCGLKLWEHSWSKNPMVAVVSALLMNKWRGNRLIWACDYHESSPEFVKSYNGVSQEVNAYEWCREVGKKYRKEAYPRYYVCLDTKEYFDMEKVYVDKDGWKPHPLPFLTADEVNSGGGARVSQDPDNQVSRWCNKRIFATDELAEVDGCEEIIFSVRE